MNLSFLPKNAFPLPAPLAPTLVALGLDNKTVATLSKVYFSSALTLKATCEAEYIRACTALLAASDERGYSSKELRSRLLTVAITRYSQTLSKWEKEARERAEVSLLQRGITAPKVKGTSSRHSRKESPRLRHKDENANVVVVGPTLFVTDSPPHAFPQPYPPPVRPEPVSFMTHVPLLERGSSCKPRAVSDKDIDACVDTLSRLSLGPPSPQRSSHTPSKAVFKPRSRIYPTSNPKLTSPLSPSHPRLVSPILDTSIAVPHRPLPKNIPSHLSPTNTSHTQSIDIPRSNRRKICSIPYRRPVIHPSTSPESPSTSHFSRSIRRTPSLISDHGSEASSPSTPPDFPPMFTPTSTLTRKGYFPEVMSPLDRSPTRHPEWHDIDFGANLYSRPLDTVGSPSLG